MLNQINIFRNISKEFEMSEDDQNNLEKIIFSYKNEFNNSKFNTHAYFSENDLNSDEFDPHIIDKKKSIEEVINFLKIFIDKSGVNQLSSNAFGHIPGGNLYPAVLGDYIASFTNKFSSVYFSAPGAVKLENTLIKWIAKLIGFPETAGGVLTSGGSMANLIALTSARESIALKSRDYERTVVYVTNKTHHSIFKSLKTIGLGEAHIRQINIDNKYRMCPNHLQSEIEKDKNKNLIPWLIVASAGSTDIGSVDPIDEISNISNKFNLWLHIDAAYGGFFILTEKGKQLFKNISSANSITLDPHKSFYMPYGLGIIVVKDQQNLLNTFSSQASYMRDCKSINECPSPADLSPELTRNFRSLRLWLPLKIFGIEPFKAALEEKLLLAQYLYSELKKINRMEVLCEPELTIVVFRFQPENSEKINDFNEMLMQKIQKDGRIFLSSTNINNDIYLRIACLSFRTHIENIDFSLKIIFEKIEEIIMNSL
ncbi:pyridoxal phosphate-dependent decarboxylase family protein [Fluviispira multicolorata]|uniref:Aminotransferase class V-fold PLP-dependent enzyme n=1 Tax=Fluviispira multicolorata TaxID=2654512 RepID=A0A833N1V3_9BACT|nr:aminotransferase class V-fold PLP-dependent enzyme [Fluviispira multicolorata]KAB8031777.1 aminotransferase class V-fold PLP-dependent enzyme [Fluviispira multicolorata]